MALLSASMDHRTGHSRSGRFPRRPAEVEAAPCSALPPPRTFRPLLMLTFVSRGPWLRRIVLNGASRRFSRNLLPVLGLFRSSDLPSLQRTWHGPLAPLMLKTFWPSLPCQGSSAASSVISPFAFTEHLRQLFTRTYSEMCGGQREGWFLS